MENGLLLEVILVDKNSSSQIKGYRSVKYINVCKTDFGVLSGYCGYANRNESLFITLEIPRFFKKKTPQVLYMNMYVEWTTSKAISM